MIRQSRAAAPDSTGAFDALETGRITWVGLGLASVGWALLLGETTVVDIFVAKTPRPVSSSFHADLFDIAKCIIASGFALAIIGALQTGFGALNRFFEAVLMRSSQRAAAPEPARGPMAPDISPHEPKRPYRILADGSVEVETIVGTRKFETLAEAREFF